MVCGVHSLPDEILAQIFSHLDPHSKVNASSTCKRWMHTMNNYPELFEDVRVYFKQFNEINIPIMKFSTLTRKFSYFHFTKTILNKKSLRFLKKYAKQFHRLSFDHCSIFEYDLLEPCEKNTSCINLQVLEVWGVNVCVLFGNLPKLKKLHISMETGFTDEDMMHLHKITPLTLTEFGISTHVVCERRIIKRYYSDETMFKTQPVDVFLSYLAVEHFIRQRCSNLHTLDFSESNISEKPMMVLSKMEGLRLKTLKVAKCFCLGNILPIFCNNQPRIVVLNLKGVLIIKDPSMVAICTTLTQLEDLDLTHCDFINESVVNIFQLKHLRRLYLTSCVRITPASFSNAIDGLACRDLKYLSLCATRINDQILSRLLPLVSGLRELDLNSCGITNLGVSAITRNLGSLRLLNLNHCSRISDKGLMGRVERTEEPSLPLSNMKRLEELYLKHCNQLTEYGLIRSIRFQRLFSLNVTGCVPLTEAGRQMLKYSNPNLKHFEYSEPRYASLISSHGARRRRIMPPRIY